MLKTRTRAHYQTNDVEPPPSERVRANAFERRVGRTQLPAGVRGTRRDSMDADVSGFHRHQKGGRGTVDERSSRLGSRGARLRDLQAVRQRNLALEREADPLRAERVRGTWRWRRWRPATNEDYLDKATPGLPVQQHRTIRRSAFSFYLHICNIDIQQSAVQKSNQVEKDHQHNRTTSHTIPIIISIHIASLHTTHTLHTIPRSSMQSCSVSYRQPPEILLCVSVVCIAAVQQGLPRLSRPVHDACFASLLAA